MCGISGFITRKPSSVLDLDCLKTMVSKLSHRGPNNKGHWQNNNNTQFIGHTRLSIIDLSENGNQPMLSSSERYVISYNGEIYNHLDIRKELDNIKKISWRSTSDTETILESIENFGITRTIEKIHGMFSICIIDRKKNLLHLARDKFGEKPLYYGFSKDNFLFASELKAIVSFPSFEKMIDKKSLNYFFNFSYIPEPNSIYKNISKLSPGTILTFDLNIHKIINNEKFNTFCKNEDFQITEENAVEQFDSTINLAVKNSMISDVEVGSFLSGGVDSSLITSIMQNQSSKNIKTFSIVFEDLKYDEKYYSRNISKHLGTDHNELLINSKDMIDISKKIPEIYDEPFADSSQIPTVLISQFAAKKVKVILSGDGADEFYGGYNRYIAFSKMNKILKYCPYNIRYALGKIISLIPLNLLTYMEIILGKLFLQNRSVTQLDDKIKKLGSILMNSKSIADMYFSIISLSESIPDLLNHKDAHNEVDEIKEKINSYFYENKDFVENVMVADQNMYLTGDILHKVDRASMHYSLETRIPFLNPNIINFSNKLNMNMKIKGNTGKFLLREVLKKYIPDKYINRPKMGFSIPLNEWLKGPLKEWSMDKLNLEKIKQENYLNDKQVKYYLENHFSDKKDFSRELWNIIVFQSWLSKYN
jgi:asparagine synthase (glutamine-hydrolysing)